MSADTYTNIFEVIEKVQRDNDYGQDLDWMDAVEWAGECLDLIGAPRTYVPLTACLDIEDHKAELPCDFSQVVQVRDNASGHSMRVTTSNYFPEYYSESCPDTPDSTSELINQGTYRNADLDSKLLQGESFTDRNVKSHYPDVGLTYFIKGTHVFTSFKEGQVLMSYLAFPTDENYYPLIPANESYKQAVKHYIQERMDWRQFRKGKVPQAIWQESHRKRTFYVGQAESQGKQPTLDEMESWKNSWLRLIPKIDQHHEGFASQGVQEQRYTQNSYQGLGKGYYGSFGTQGT